MPSRMATDFVGLRAMPFSQNQMRREFKHNSSAEMSWLYWLAKEQHIVACRPRTADERLGVN